MRISKYDLITEIAKLCDELEAARRELRDVERGIATCKDMEDEKINPADLLCVSAGRNKIFEDCTYTCSDVSATRDEETGEIKVTTFERFRDSALYRCPDTMSKREFFEYFDGEFRATYEEEREKAIAELKEADDD